LYKQNKPAIMKELGLLLDVRHSIFKSVKCQLTWASWNPC